MRTLLCVSNYPSNTGFAWDFIEGLYAGLADRLGPKGVRTLVAYPRIEEPPRSLEGSCARAVEQDFRLRDPRSLREALTFIRREGADALYLSDRASWDPAYALMRLAGVKTIVVHDHTSGERSRPTGLKRLVKRARVHVPGTLADRVLGVSDFVAARKVDVDLVPPGRVERVWNSVVLDEPGVRSLEDLRHRFGLDRDRLVVACAGRASREKGLPILLRAFDRLIRRWHGAPPALVYMGDGPAMDELRRLHGSLEAAEAIFLPGYVPHAVDYLASADVAAVPSVWQEAFGLAALEPMSRGVPVVASEVGGLPEVVRHGEEGLLVPPGDEKALAAALEKLLGNPDLRSEMGRRGRLRARECFGRQAQLDRLEEIFLGEMGLAL